VNTIDFPDIPCGFPVPIHYQYNSAAISDRKLRGQGWNGQHVNSDSLPIRKVYRFKLTGEDIESG
jgi:hypothetical protein